MIPGCCMSLPGLSVAIEAIKSYFTYNISPGNCARVHVTGCIVSALLLLVVVFSIWMSGSFDEILLPLTSYDGIRGV